MKASVRKVTPMVRCVLGIVLLCLSTACILRGGAAAQNIFSNPSFPTLQFPDFVGVADLNNDGKPDIVVATGERDQFSIFLGPTYQIRQDYTVGLAPNSFYTRLQDVNGDGKPDLIFYAGNTVRVLPGKGDGTFGVPIISTVGLYQEVFTLADVNGDSIPDIITVNWFVLPGALQILLGNGDGTFRLGQSLTADYLSNNIAVGDVDGDGKPDIVMGIPRIVNPPVYKDPALLIFKGDGTGQFTRLPDNPLGVSPYGLALADFDHDGKLDLALTCVLETNYDGRVRILHGNGDGTFTPQVEYFIGTAPYGLTVADVDGDGKLDLITINASSHNLSLLKGNGDGTFQPHDDYPVSAGPGAVAVADVTGDGHSDLVTLCSAASALVIVNSRPDNTLHKRYDYLIGNEAYSVAAADLDGSGNAAIVTTSSIYSGSVSVLQITGRQATRHDYPVSKGPVDILLADMNHDGKLDIVTTSNYDSHMSLLYGNGDATFQDFLSLDVGQKQDGLGIGDLNNDGIPDIVVSTANKSLSINLFDGTSLSPEYFIFLGGWAKNILLTDINNDGFADLITGSTASSGIFVYRGKGDGTFGDFDYYPTGNAPYFLTMGDLNGDGKPDIVTSNAFDGTVSVLLNNGDGTFAPQVVYKVGKAPQSLALGDLDGDGKLDLVTLNGGSRSLSVLFGNGDGTFRPKTDYAVGTGPEAITLGDVNGDGRLDIIVVNFGDSLNNSTVSVLYNELPGVVRVGGVVQREGLASSAPSQILSLEFRPQDGTTGFTKSVSVAADGKFMVTEIPTKTYQVRVTAARYLASVITLDTTAGSVSNFAVSLRVGDATGDNRVDIGDFNALVNAYGTAINDGSGFYDPNADFNSDGRVDLGDFGLLLNNYGATGDD